MVQPPRKTILQFLKQLNIFLWPSESILSYIPKQHFLKSPQKYLYIHADSTIITNSQKVETIQIPITNSHKV